MPADVVLGPIRSFMLQRLSAGSNCSIYYTKVIYRQPHSLVEKSRWPFYLKALIWIKQYP